ncbi:hypothetical protein M409DRAFT_54004 [Zasmidium cellare ATCC 36951]|uniref:Heterokaryon incompatibility domain-containing protein n=1 Tax=Zasmidium cellare ATCC 36951 TaxID=1080233 RepID=A0A6A6CNA6_ZASCE|nr:uncharacterized protein M409DRAFT_54004 [Zasmidium cellare ATCC 36951]KAF2167402.1 hypothetical protein M409DRAFT_54004 [Zasmidium cellare ATCC 36951]
MAGKRKRASSPARTAHFVHEPFVDASKQIRLLTFEPGNDLDSISCNISTWSFDKARPYVAASYTWGSPENISCININGLPYEIRRNCYDALSQIRRQAPESYVWTDSICINQLDLDEKALQVENMGDIFANAELVYSCVGEHADGSGDVFSVAQDVAAHVKDTPLFYDMPTDNGAAWIAHGGDPRSPAWQRLNALQPDPIKDSEGGMVNSPPHPKFRDALMFFSCRPYWHRIWIIQEVYLAQRCIVLCGDDCVAFEDIVVLMITYQYALFVAVSMWAFEARLPQVARASCTGHSKMHARSLRLPSSHTVAALLILALVSCPAIFSVMLPWVLGFVPGGPCFESTVSAIYMSSLAQRFFAQHTLSSRIS